ncbi:cytochrome oxidase assembly protein-domain-containing protein [Jimgerdemannia flammicorona]|uniref:Cytochrome oxidase assembly protein-domain-containing protein n=1 Tax=Jimgerdemannia flammicorona TaxID=994334 RepID=A0A433QRQ5_9FUNG|nr:cytochrome oxidase assembly protein-domain-containing protein [Jimgerdemannia flammicorona]
MNIAKCGATRRLLATAFLKSPAGYSLCVPRHSSRLSIRSPPILPRVATTLRASPLASARPLLARAYSAVTPTLGADAAATTRPIVGYWLYFNAAMTFMIVVVGGLTRLTESGLSITEWNVISGMKPPRSQQEWEEEFDKYKQFPEYKILNRHMTLHEFKSIFYWEWVHRMIGRLIGVSFIVPGLYFAARGYMSPATKNVVFGITALVGFQGFMGWYMVKSGLAKALLEQPGAVPRVSQYRLTAHLATAFAIYTATVMVGARILRDAKIAAGSYPKAVAEALRNPALASFRRYAHYLTMLIFFTAMSGGLVAGLDAGLIYNEFPLMGGRIVPSSEELWSDHYVKEGDRTKLRNALENPVLVQFDHRVMAEFTFLAVTALWLYARRLPLPPNARVAVNTTMGVALVQVTLGISTLLYMVPIELASAHQAGALGLLTSSLWIMHAIKRVPL